MNNLELKILNFLLNRDNYVRYKEAFNESFKDKDNPLRKIFLALESYMESEAEVDVPCTASILNAYFFTKFSYLKKEELDYFGAVFDRLASLDIEGTDSAVQILISHYQEKHSAKRAATLLLNVVEGKADGKEVFPEVASILSQDKIPQLDSKEAVVDSDLDSILNEVYTGGGLNWRLRCLKESLGPLRKGDFGFIFARPETGKTTFLASEATNFAEQSEAPILWFNNEEQSKKVILRCYSAAFGASTREIVEKRGHFAQKWRDYYRDRLYLYDASGFTYRDIDRLVSRHDNVGCIIFDQIDKIKGFQDDRNDLMLGEIYLWARELAKKHAPVIGVCQADGSGEGIMWLNMNHVANAKTSKQAEADFILGIGKVHDQSKSGLRYLNISKNKLIGDQNTREELRHSQHTVLIHPEIARYEDV